MRIRKPKITCVQIYTSFFCRQNEPSYIKLIKLDILSAIADESNAFDIATELTEYVADPDEELSRAAVRAVGKIALEVLPLYLLGLFHQVNQAVYVTRPTCNPR